MNLVYNVLKQDMNGFVSLAKSLQDCTYSLDVTQDVCMNEEKCYEQSVVALRSGLVKLRLYKLVDCKCALKFNYHCKHQDKNYCAIHSDACDSFKTWLNSNDSDSNLQINRCNI